MIFILAGALPAAEPPKTSGDIQRSLSGNWAGVLEYRDFSEPPTSTKRTRLPTWVSVEPAGEYLRFRYTYDDGPNKIATSTEVVQFDAVAARYQIRGEDGSAQDTARIQGLESLKEGRGTLVLNGDGVENDAKVKVRTTFRIGRNILEITRESGPDGAPLAFRHAYVLVRSAVPQGK